MEPHQHLPFSEARLLPLMSQPPHIDPSALAFSLLRQDRYTEAHRIWREIHNARQHVTYDASWCNELDLIGLRLYLHKRYVEAEPYLIEALAEKEGTLPHGNAQILKSRMHVARVYDAQGKFEEAVDMMRYTLEWFEKYGGDEEEVWQCMSELAYVLAKQGKVGEAEGLAVAAMHKREEKMGLEHPVTLEGVWLLGSIHDKAGRSEEAKRLYRRAYEGAREVLGDEHEDVKDYGRDLARLHDQSRK
jgi:tetratricopeptide (TPR) repeat protein